MNKALISGYYGFNNLGDEAILETMIRSISRMDEKVELTVLTASPETTKADLGIETVHRSKLLSVIKAVMDTDILISGGGSLLQDTTSKRSIHYYLAIIIFGLIFRKPIMLYSHGIGPVSKPGNRRIMKWVLSRVDAITVRESNSKIDLINMGIDPDKIHVTADPVVDMEKIEMALGRDILKKAFDRNIDDKPLVGISMRTKDFQTEADRQKLEKLIQSLTPSYNIVMIPFHLKEDLDICVWAKSDTVAVIDKEHTAGEIMSVVENLDALIGVRLHSLIFAAVAEVPLIGISYDPKIDYFLETLGLEAIGKIKDFEPNQIKDALDAIIADRDIAVQYLSEHVHELRMKFKTNELILGNLLQRGKMHG